MKLGRYACPRPTSRRWTYWRPFATVFGDETGPHEQSLARLRLPQRGWSAPVVTPCRKRHGTFYWKVLARGQVAHDAGCVFHRTRTRRLLDAARWNRPPRRAPEGFFVVLRARPRSSDSRAPAVAPRREASGRESPGWHCRSFRFRLLQSEC